MANIQKCYDEYCPSCPRYREALVHGPSGCRGDGINKYVICETCQDFPWNMILAGSPLWIITWVCIKNHVSRQISAVPKHSLL